jgi:methylated-DNA-protein-cysteine methyltransferase-like protein
LLRTDTPDLLPWHRVVGAGGAIKLRQDGQEEQRQRLLMEGVRFRDKRVDMEAHEHAFRLWEKEDPC